jgi:HEAT repeat protein
MPQPTATRPPVTNVQPSSAPLRSPVARRWLTGLALALVAFALGSLLLQYSRRNQPILTLLSQVALGPPADRNAARAELIELAPEAAPVLVRVIRRAKTRWRTELLPWFESIPQISRHRTHQLRLERSAIDTLQRMGPRAAPAILPLLTDTRYGGRDTALALLRSSGAEVCPLLIETLRDDNPALRSGAAMALGKFPVAMLGSLTPLRSARKDPEPSVRSASLWALSQMQDRPEEVVPELVDGLADTAAPVRLQAITGLRTFGSHATSAMDPLRRILRSDTPQLRTEATSTLATFGPTARSAETELLANLRNESALVSRQSAATLALLDLHTPRALEHLRIRTLDLIGTLGSRAEPLVPTLLTFLENTDSRDDRATLGALRNIQPDAIPERFRRGNRPRP